MTITNVKYIPWKARIKNKPRMALKTAKSPRWVKEITGGGEIIDGKAPGSIRFIDGHSHIGVIEDSLTFEVPT